MSHILNFLNVYKYPVEQRRQFFFNIFLSSFIMIFFVVMKDTVMRQNFINGWFDWYIILRLDENTDTAKTAQDIVFLDFDNKSLQTLGKTDITPRDKVAELINIAYKGGADIVVVDFDLSENDYSPAKKFDGEDVPKTGAERDDELFNLIQTIKNDSDSRQKILLPLLTYADRTVKPNRFASLIDNEKIFAVTSTFTVNRVGDNYARFWLPYLEIKDTYGDTKILWSIPLLTSVLYKGDYTQLELLNDDIISGSENSFVTPITYEEQVKLFEFYREQTIEGDLLRDSTALQYNRIQYAVIPSDVIPMYPFGTISPSNVGHWRKNGLDNSHIDFKNKIVVIGRADEDCADFFSTPVGNVAGMYIHGNSIASILGKTRPHLTPLYKHIFIEIFLILVAAYSFLALSERKAKIIILVLTPICFVLSYVYFCFTNEFVYLSFAFTAVGVYNFVNNIQTFIVSGLSFRSFIRRL